MKIVSIVGARPQFVKLGPLSRLIRETFQEVIIHTGQHFNKEMSELFFADLELPQPEYNLNINSGNHGEQTGRMMIELEDVIIKTKPAIIIIFGDTNSTLAGALVAAKLHIPVIHVEAGLRSFNKFMPEEINRVVADHVSDFLYTPTENAMRNLKKEGLIEKAINTGDIMVDSIKYAKSRGNLEILKNLRIVSENYYLLTLHRPYNVDDVNKLYLILDQVESLDKTVVFPIHPRTEKNLKRSSYYKNINFIEPLGYLDFITLQVNAYKIITDSGGIQKESYLLRKPCVTLRSETEWVETVEAGWNLLVKEIEPNLTEKITQFSPPTHYPTIFGDEVAYKMFNHIKSLS